MKNLFRKTSLQNIATTLTGFGLTVYALTVSANAALTYGVI